MTTLLPTKIIPSRVQDYYNYTRAQDNFFLETKKSNLKEIKSKELTSTKPPENVNQIESSEYKPFTAITDLPMTSDLGINDPYSGIFANLKNLQYYTKAA